MASLHIGRLINSKIKRIFAVVFMFMMVSGIMSTSVFADYGVALSISGTHTFPTQQVGYAPLTPLSVTATTSRPFPRVYAQVEIIGENADSFTLVNSWDDPWDGSVFEHPHIFTVVPNNDLPVGIYTATVSLSSPLNLTQYIPTPISFNVSFTVTESTTGNVLTRLIVASPGEGSFGDTVILTRVGNQDIGAGVHPEGLEFSHWTVHWRHFDFDITHFVSFADPNSANTTFSWDLTQINFGLGDITATAHFRRVGSGTSDDEYFDLTVIGGGGSGRFRAGTRVCINAWTHPWGWRFGGWVSSPRVQFDNAWIGSTCFTMPASNITVWVDGWHTGGGTGGSGGTIGGGGGTGTAPIIGRPQGYFTVVVIGGNGGGTFRPGQIVSINAFGELNFTSWQSSPGVGFGNASSPNTSFSMPASNVVVWFNEGIDILIATPTPSPTPTPTPSPPPNGTPTPPPNGTPTPSPPTNGTPPPTPTPFPTPTPLIDEPDTPTPPNGGGEEPIISTPPPWITSTGENTDFGDFIGIVESGGGTGTGIGTGATTSTGSGTTTGTGTGTNTSNFGTVPQTGVSGVADSITTMLASLLAMVGSTIYILRRKRRENNNG